MYCFALQPEAHLHYDCNPMHHNGVRAHLTVQLASTVIASCMAWRPTRSGFAVSSRKPLDSRRPGSRNRSGTLGRRKPGDPGEPEVSKKICSATAVRSRHQRLARPHSNARYPDAGRAAKRAPFPGSRRSGSEGKSTARGPKSSRRTRVVRTTCSWRTRGSSTGW
jgi:hypothetical protein